MKRGIRKTLSRTITKRQKFVFSVLLLSLGLFFSEHLLGKSGVFMGLVLSLLSGILFYLCVRDDASEQTVLPLFILPFFYTLSLALFYFLVPARFLTRLATTSLYALGLYSLYLSQNIFVVGSIRTIALLAGARIVSFVITVVSYFFLTRVVFSLDLPLVVAYTLRPLLLFGFSFLLIVQSLWTQSLENELKKHALWATLLSLCLLEVALILGFWPTTPTFIAIFLTGFFYTIVGLSHVWFARRLFKGVQWEYLWVAAIVFFILMLATAWRG